MSTLSLTCSCGQLRGRVENAPAGDYMVCMCEDCQTYAHWLGNAENWLDEAGGSAVFQTYPAAVNIEAGENHLACAQLSPSGPYRWYASCCRTPIGNTMRSRRAAFVGLSHSCLQSETGELTEAIGPLRGKLFGSHAVGPITGKAHAKVPISLMLRIFPKLAKDTLIGRAKPSPFFDASGDVSRTPTVLTKEERQGLLQDVRARRVA